MKTYSFAALLVVAFCFAFSNTAHATVGGPTHVWDLRFNPQTKSVLYIEQSHSGKGCPPVLNALSIETDATKAIYDCNSYEDNRMQMINDYVSDFESLRGINLKKNNISVTFKVVSEEKLEGEDYTLFTNFVASVFQNGKKLAEIPFKGCSAKQPLTVAGYNIPAVADKMILLFSTKGDCWEGGYTFEAPHIISGASIVIDDQYNGQYKYDSALIPDEGNLVVYANKETQTPIPPVANSNPTRATNDLSASILVMIGVVGLMLGGLLGRVSKKNNTPTV